MLIGFDGIGQTCERCDGEGKIYESHRHTSIACHGTVKEIYICLYKNRDGFL